MFQQILVTGIFSSAIYFLLALGFALVFGVGRIINLSHTALYMVAAYVIFTLVKQAGANVILSIAVSIIFTTLIGAATYKLVIERVREHEITVMIVTLALALVFQELMVLFFTSKYYGIDNYIPGYVNVLGIRVTNQQVLSLLVAVLCAALVSIFLTRTKVGLAIRVTAQDREIANLMGINVDQMCIIAVTIAAALSSIAGAFVAPIYVVQPYMWLSPLVTVMAIVVLGGLGSTTGALIGALIIGFTETCVIYFVPQGSFLRDAVAMLVMIIALLVKPEGLFGVVFEEERL